LIRKLNHFSRTFAAQGKTVCRRGEIHGGKSGQNRAGRCGNHRRAKACGAPGRKQPPERVRVRTERKRLRLCAATHKVPAPPSARPHIPAVKGCSSDAGG